MDVLVLGISGGKPWDTVGRKDADKNLGNVVGFVGKDGGSCAQCHQAHCISQEMLKFCLRVILKRQLLRAAASAAGRPPIPIHKTPWLRCIAMMRVSDAVITAVGAS